MLISVIIPTINRVDALQRAIQSVLTAIEFQKIDAETIGIIIVNDSDESVDIDEFKNKTSVSIQIIRSPKAPFGGPSLARHIGILNSAADLIFFLDDDDYFLPNRFEYCLDLYEKHNSLDCVLEPSLRKDLNNGLEFIAGAKGDVENGFKWMISGGQSRHIATGATSFRRLSYFDVGGLDLKLRHGEDGELLLRLAYYKNLIFTYPNAVVVCERHASNISHESKRRPFQNMSALRRLYKNTRKKVNPSHEEVLKIRIQGKFAFLLSRCISDYSYPRRVFETLRVAYFYPLSCANRESYKSLLVALFKVYYR